MVIFTDVIVVDFDFLPCLVLLLVFAHLSNIYYCCVSLVSRKVKARYYCDIVIPEREIDTTLHCTGCELSTQQFNRGWVDDDGCGTTKV